jgi:hypothetical protein
MDDVLADAGLTQKLRSLDAVFLRVLFEVDVVKQTDDSPILCVVTVAEFLCIPLHHAFDRQCVLDMEMILIVLSE